MPQIADKVNPSARAIIDRLQEHGYEAVFVGGCVRDSLLGKPVKDWDIATNATPDEIASLFEETLPVGKSFGVMLVRQHGQFFEVSTFRTERCYSDGRRPDDVVYATKEEDANRRDFTINALMYDPTTDRVLDFVGGQEDVTHGRIRTVGDPAQRFFEDHLRLLRAVRFATKVGFDLEDTTMDAIREHAGLVVTVSGERIGEELRRMFSEGTAEHALSLLDTTNLLLHVLPEIARMRGVPQPEAFHPEGDVLTHTRLMCRLLDAVTSFSIAQADSSAHTDTDEVEALPDVYTDENNQTRVYFPTEQSRERLAWMVLLHDVAKPETIHFRERIRFDLHDRQGAEIAHNILRRLRRPKHIIQPVCDVIGRHMRFSEIDNMREAKRRRWLNDPCFLYDLELHRIDSEASHGKLDTYAFALEAFQQERAREPAPDPLITGKDLLAIGYSPGPQIGNILTAVEDERLEGRLTTSDEALAWVKQQFPHDTPGHNAEKR